MSLPRLHANVKDPRAIAAILRAALLHEVCFIPLSEEPEGWGQHLLEVDVPGEGVVRLLAEPIGPAAEMGHPLHVMPVTRPQMAALFPMIERLDEPSPQSQSPEHADAMSPYSDRTVVEAVRFRASDMPPASSGSRESLLPPPPSSDGPMSLVPVSARFVAPPPSVDLNAPQSQASGIIGRLIAGKYKVESLIGSGSTAAVYRATHADLNRAVAVKILHEQKSQEAQFVSRFKVEARAASRLEHPNVARVLDFGQEREDGMLYLVMELLDGRSLEAILAASGRLEPKIAVDLLIQACSAVAFAHDIGIIHRDIKPENLMLVAHRDDDGNPCDLVKVCDFGLAKLRDPDPQREELTTAGMLCGSPAYMSPEQTRGAALDLRTDVYSLGVTLYECLTGALPHDGFTLEELFANKMMKPPRPLRKIVPELDEGLEAIVLHSIATDPAKRHSSVRALRDELKKTLPRAGA